jgi:hypothetical protein
VHKIPGTGSGDILRKLAFLVTAVILVGVCTTSWGNEAQLEGRFNFTGDVISVNVPGQGVVLALIDRNVAVHGLGPLWYWDAQGWSLPAVGQAVKVLGWRVRYQERIFYVARSLAFGGRTLQLRRPEDGLPVWHGQGLYIPLKETQP